MAKGSVLSQPNGMELIPSELFLIRDGPLFGWEGGGRASVYWDGTQEH